MIADPHWLLLQRDKFFTARILLMRPSDDVLRTAAVSKPLGAHSEGIDTVRTALVGIGKDKLRSGGRSYLNPLQEGGLFLVVFLPSPLAMTGSFWVAAVLFCLQQCRVLPRTDWERGC